MIVASVPVLSLHGCQSAIRGFVVPIAIDAVNSEGRFDYAEVSEKTLKLEPLFAYGNPLAAVSFVAFVPASGFHQRPDSICPGLGKPVCSHSISCRLHPKTSTAFSFMSKPEQSDGFDISALATDLKGALVFTAWESDSWSFPDNREIADDLTRLNQNLIHYG